MEDSYAVLRRAVSRTPRPCEAAGKYAVWLVCSGLSHPRRPAADVALAWLLQNPVVTAPIIGPRAQEQLDGALRALDITLTPEQNEHLNALFPGRKTAPEDYAW